MKRITVVYVAGPYRSPTAWGVRQNIESAARVAAQVWEMGLVALCPHLNSAHMEGVASDEAFLAGTMELLRRCDVVVMAPGWSSSTGAIAERMEAGDLGLQVFDTVDELRKYVSGLLAQTWLGKGR